MITVRSSRSCHVLVLAAAAVSLAGASAHAQLTLLPLGPQLGTHAGNLVTNGSFEFRNAALQPGPGATGSSVFWATGTLATPFAVPYGWSSSGGPNTYANWGGDLGAPVRHRGSDALPHGVNAMYFGNGQSSTVNVAPIFNASGEVTFASPRTIVNTGTTFPVPCVLTQTVNTHLTPSPSYLLSMWISGEGSGSSFAGPGAEGIFGLRVTNTQAGDPIRYFAVPSGSSTYGSSLRLEFNFVPINPSAPVTIEFINWGHFSLAPFGMGGTTELVLDDVIVNAVPAPSAAGLLGLAGIRAMGRRRRA